MSRRSKTITFSLPPELPDRVEQCKKDDYRTTSELLREALRCYFEEREWKRAARSKLGAQEIHQEDPDPDGLNGLVSTKPSGHG